MKTQQENSKDQQKATAPQVQQEVSTGGAATMEDNRSSTVIQQKLRSSMDAFAAQAAPIQRKANNTGLPDNLKSGIENLSGFAMDDVKVHYNSSKPAQLRAHAYAQGSEIHLAPGQEKHLAHEAWHVVQQKQGRVKPTRQLKSKVSINDDAGLEKEADVMGEKALQFKMLNPPIEGGGQYVQSGTSENQPLQKKDIGQDKAVVQRNKKKSAGAKVGIEIETTLPVRKKVEETAASKARQTELIKLIKELNGLNKNDPKVPEKKKEIKRKRNIISAEFDPQYKTVVHRGNKWNAVVDHVPRVRKNFEAGNVPIDSAVEIVTDPVGTEEEAETIMEEIHAWIKTVLGNIDGENKRHEEKLTNVVKEGVGKERQPVRREREYLFEIPEKVLNVKEEDLKLFDGEDLIGNIQVNVGARLEDVIDVFKGNRQSINTTQKRLVDMIGGEDLWDSVKLNFNKNKFRENIQPEDEIYLRSIMFLYLYNSASAVIMPKDQTMKNQFPILGKTSISQQISLSGWDNMDKWLKSKNLSQRTLWWFKTRFYNAIVKALKNSKFQEDFEINNKGMKDIVEFLGNMKENKEPMKIGDLTHIDNPDHLKLDDDSYAGVFELRGFQDKDIPASDWANVWLSFFNSEIHNPLLQKPTKKLKNYGGGTRKFDFKNLGGILSETREKIIKKTKTEPEEMEVI